MRHLVILLASIFLLHYNASAQVEYQSLYDPHSYDEWSKILKNAQARYDKNVENIRLLLNWIGDLKSKQIDDELLNALNSYQTKLQDLLTNGTDLGLVTKDLILIQNAISDEIAEFNQRVSEKNKKIAEENDPSNIFNKGMEIIKKGDFNSAMGNFKKVIELAPAFAPGHFYLGFCYFMQGLYATSISYFNKAIELKPTPTVYNYKGWAEYYNKDYLQAVQDFTLQIEISKPDDASGYYNRGSAKSELNDFYGAIVDYKKAIEINPNFSMAYNNLGWIYFKKKDLVNALKYVNKAIEIDSENSVAFDSKAEIEFNLNDYKSAVSDCNRALVLNPKMANSYFIRGRAYYRLGKKDDACQDWSTAGQYGKSDAYDYISKYCK